MAINAISFEGSIDTKTPSSATTQTLSCTLQRFCYCIYLILQDKRSLIHTTMICCWFLCERCGYEPRQFRITNEYNYLFDYEKIRLIPRQGDMLGSAATITKFKI